LFIIPPSISTPKRGLIKRTLATGLRRRGIKAETMGHVAWKTTISNIIIWRAAGSRVLIAYISLTARACCTYQFIIRPMFKILIVDRLRETLRTAKLLVLAALFLLHNQIALGAACTSKARKDIVIALDVGHIASNLGGPCYRLMPKRCPSGQTSARGVPEYDFNIKLAERINQELVISGFISTYVLITQLDGTAGRQERADRANSMNADLFLSIHHDGVGDEYLRSWIYNDEEHFFFDDSKGFSLHVSPENRHYEESLTLARILADQLMGAGLEFTRVHEPSNPAGAGVPFVDSTRGIYKRTNFIVLGKTEMPAVLLEAGVIVNRSEELVVSTPGYRGIIARAIIGAIARFCNLSEE
jgi:N-acetylmuramoyl-L-alanine amidase